MNIPHKVQIFECRACKDFLPCLNNLSRRRDEVDTRCKFCPAPIEDLSHTLYYCPDIKESWPPFLGLISSEASPNLTFLELVKWVKSKGNAEEFERFFVITWSLWGRHNKRLFEGKNESPLTTIGRAISYCRLHAEALTVPSRDLRLLSHWQPPPQGYFKVNVDGVLFLDYKAVGIGVILRDSSGEVLLASTIHEKQMQNPERALRA